VGNDHDGGWGAPPPAGPKRRNAVLRLYDAPVYRDWAFWSTFGWGIFSGWAIGTAPSTSNLPRWVDALLAAAVFSVFFGIIPAFVRLQYRRWRWRRMNTDRKNEPHAVSAPRSPAGSEQGPQRKEGQVWQHDGGTKDTAAPPSRSAPASITSLSAEALASSSVLASCRASLQYPIARCVRTLQLATDPKDRYEAILDTAEAISVTLGATAAAWLRSESLGPETLAELQRSYERGVSQGTWHSVIRALERHSARHEGAIPGSVEALRFEKGGGGLLADLRVLLEERNRWAHGARPHNKSEAAARVVELFGPLERCLKKCGFLTGVPWILTQGSSYRRRHTDFEIIAQRAMGDHPEFERSRFASTTPLADDTFYALTLRGPIDLTPFVVIRYCHTCRQREVCHADRLDKKHGVALKSFTTGHVIFDDTLTEEIVSLFPSA
jgi:hypothetical protein